MFYLLLAAGEGPAKSLADEDGLKVILATVLVLYVLLGRKLEDSE